jgi:uncharacterized protein (TIGR03085 family)
VSRSYPARAERSALCDLLAEVGPDQPTLCTGWTTRDLAAHVIARERRPDAAIGNLIPPLRGHTDAVRERLASQHSYAELIEMVRRPPAFSLSGPAFTDKAVNTAEFFIHHEDVRRGVTGWQSRVLSADLERALYGQLKLVGRLRLRKFQGRIKINIRGYAQPIVTGATAGPEVEVTGDVGELTLFMSGRQEATQVEITGPEDLANRLRAANLGI